MLSKMTCSKTAEPSLQAWIRILVIMLLQGKEESRNAVIEAGNVILPLEFVSARAFVITLSMQLSCQSPFSVI